MCLCLFGSPTRPINRSADEIIALIRRGDQHRDMATASS